MKTIEEIAEYINERPTEQIMVECFGTLFRVDITYNFISVCPENEKNLYKYAFPAYDGEDDWMLYYNKLPKCREEWARPYSMRTVDGFDLTIMSRKITLKANSRTLMKAVDGLLGLIASNLDDLKELNNDFD